MNTQLTPYQSANQFINRGVIFGPVGNQTTFGGERPPSNQLGLINLGSSVLLAWLRVGWSWTPSVHRGYEWAKDLMTPWSQ